MGTIKPENEKLLLGSIFRSKIELSYYQILSVLREMSVPVGSWVLKEKLDSLDLEASTATIGRYLKEMDSKGFTKQIGNRGRIITEEGLTHLSKIELRLSRAQMHNTTTQVMTAVRYDELVDLYVARKSLEIESARIAAQTATEEEISKLAYTVMRYRQCIIDNVSFTDPALSFHLMIAESTHNKFIYAVLNLLIYEQKIIEEQFDTLETRDYAREYAEIHETIVMAISNRDSDLAAKLMEEHMNDMIELLKGQLEMLKNQKS